MTWFNEYDIDNALRQFDQDPVLGPAVRTLSNLRDWTNSNSDGWPYWVKPSRAAAKLQDLIQQEQRRDLRWAAETSIPAAQASDVRKAYVPIKAFLTRQVRAGQVVTPGIIEEVPG